MTTQENTVSEVKIKIKPPSMYKVTILNDNETPVEFVFEALVYVFHKEFKEALSIIETAEREDKALVGVYTYDMAHTYVDKVKMVAKENGYPLDFIIEEE